MRKNEKITNFGSQKWWFFALFLKKSILRKLVFRLDGSMISGVRTPPKTVKNRWKNYVIFGHRIFRVFSPIWAILGPKNDTEIIILGCHLMPQLTILGVHEAITFLKGACEGLAVDFEAPRDRFGAIWHSFLEVWPCFWGSSLRSPPAKRQNPKGEAAVLPPRVSSILLQWL